MSDGLKSAREFLWHVANLSSGTILAQVIAFGFSILIARIYDSSDFGYFSVYLGILSTLSILATGSYDKALMFASSRRSSLSLEILVFLIALSLSFALVIVGVLLMVFEIHLPLGLHYFDISVLLPLGILLMTALQLFTYNSLKAGRTRRLAFLKVSQASVTGGVQSAGGITGLNLMIFGYVAGLLLFLPILIRVITDIAKLKWKNFRLIVIASAIRYRRYPAYVCPNELVDTASSQIPLVLIGAMFSLATLGQYAFAQRILAAPAAVLGQAVSQIFFKSISAQSISRCEIRSLILRVWLSMGLIGVLPFALLLLFGEDIFLFAFGSEWSEAGQMAQILSILLFCRFVSSPTSTIYYKLNLQKAQLGYVIFAFVVRVAPIFCVFYEYSIFHILRFQVIGEIFVILMFNAHAFIKLSNSNKNVVGLT